MRRRPFSLAVLACWAGSILLFIFYQFDIGIIFLVLGNYLHHELRLKRLEDDREVR